MRTRKIDRLQQLLEAVRLFYTVGLSKTEISRRLKVSNTQVARFIREARDRGIVKIEFSPPLNAQLRQQLISRFALKDAFVVPSTKDYAFDRIMCAEVAADYFETIVKAGSSVGLGGGNTMYDIVSALPERERRIQIYPTALIGRGPSIQLPDRLMVVTLLWAKSGRKRSSAHYATILPFEESGTQIQEELERCLARPIVNQVYCGMMEVDTVFTSLGTVFANAKYDEHSPQTTLKKLTNMGIRLRDQGVVGEVSYTFFDANCHTQPDWTFAIGLGVDRLRSMVKAGKNVVVIAGKFKERALKAALAGGICSAVITDERTAQFVLLDETKSFTATTM